MMTPNTAAAHQRQEMRTFIKGVVNSRGTEDTARSAALAKHQRDGDAPPRHGYLHPNSRGKLVWDWVLVALVFHSAVLLPLRLAMFSDESLVMSVMDYIIDVMFTIDIFLNFRTGVPVDDAWNRISYDGCVISVKYLTST